MSDSPVLLVTALNTLKISIVEHTSIMSISVVVFVRHRDVLGGPPLSTVLVFSEDPYVHSVVIGRAPFRFFRKWEP